MPFLDDPVLARWVALLALGPLVWAAISDLRRMLIPDEVHFVLIGLFLVWAVLFLSPGEAGIRVLQGLVAMSVGLGMALIGGMGGGDLKLLGSSAIFIAPPDRTPTLFLLCLCMLALVALVGPTRWALKRAGRTPGWRSLHAEEKHFPLGVAISAAVGTAVAAPLLAG